MSGDKPGTAASPDRKAEAGKVDAPKVDTPKADTPKADAPSSPMKPDGTKTPAKVDSAKSDTAKSGTAKSDTAKRDTAGVDSAKSDTAKSDTSKINRTEPPRPAKSERPDKDGIVRIENRAKGRLVEPSLDAVDQLDCDSIVLHLSSDLRPLAGIASYVDWRLCGSLSALIERGVITGARGEQVLVPTNGRIRPIRLFVFGWGPQKSLADGAIDRLKAAVDVITKARVEKVAIALPEPGARVVGLVEEHIVKPLGDRLFCVFAPDSVLVERKDITRPIPASSPAS